MSRVTRSGAGLQKESGFVVVVGLGKGARSSVWVLLPFRLRKLNERSSSRKRTSTPTGRSCCGTTMSNSRKTWRRNLGKGGKCPQAGQLTMTLLRRTKVRTVSIGEKGSVLRRGLEAGGIERK